MEDTKFDLIVIGSGPAGEKGAAQAAYFGKKVALIEKLSVLGGACVNTGTLPSKTFRETALFLAGFHQRELGLISLAVQRNDSASVEDLMCRKDAVRESEIARIHANLARHQITVFHGAGWIASPNQVQVWQSNSKLT